MSRWLFVVLHPLIEGFRVRRDAPDPLPPCPGRDAASANDADVRTIRCQRFLGGLLRHYYRAAA